MDKTQDKLTQIRNEQNKKFNLFQKKFAIDDEIGGTGSFLLTSHGCFQRHNKTRAEQYTTREEDRIRNFETPNYIEYQDRINIERARVLFEKGYKLLTDESLEEFVTRLEEI